MRRLLLRSLLAGSIALLPACKRRAGEAACSSGSLAAVHPAVTVDVSGSVREARIAVAGTTFLAVWSAGSDSDSDLYARAIDATGVMASNEIRLTNITGRSQHPRIAIGAGGLGLSWQDDRLGRLDAFADVLGPIPGPVLGHAFVAPTFDATQQPSPAIAALGTGFVIVWNGRGPDANDHLYAQGMGADGAVAGSPLALVPDFSDRATAPVAASLGSAIAVADAEARIGLAAPPDIFTYLVSGTGAAAAARFATAMPAERPELAVSGDVAGVIWADPSTSASRHVWFGAFGPTGVVEPQRDLSGGNGDAADGSVAAGAGFFLATWTVLGATERKIYFQTIGENGIPEMSPRRIAGASASSSADAATLARPAVAWNGRVAGVTWVDSGHLKFQPLECTLGDFPAPSPTATP